MRFCSIEGCANKYYAKGICLKHYHLKWQHEHLSKIREIRKSLANSIEEKCFVKNCKVKIYSKGLCHVHYELNRRNGFPGHIGIKDNKCSIEWCNGLATKKTGLCSFHQIRKQRKIPLHIPKGLAFSGKRNPLWKGGVAEYPNHSEMKRIRLEVLKEANYKCEYCGKKANEIHHKDFSKDNHSKDNLVPCCRKCNAKIRDPNKPQMSKYRKKYGYARYELKEMGILGDIILMEMANKTNEIDPEKLMVMRQRIKDRWYDFNSPINGK